MLFGIVPICNMLLCRSPFFKEPSKPFSSGTINENCKEEPSARSMHAVKIVRLHHSPITHLSVWDNYVVTGGSDGYVRFYDPHLGLVGWFEELQAGVFLLYSGVTVKCVKSLFCTIFLAFLPCFLFYVCVCVW